MTIAESQASSCRISRGRHELRVKNSMGLPTFLIWQRYGLASSTSRGEVPGGVETLRFDGFQGVPFVRPILYPPFTLLLYPSSSVASFCLNQAL